MTGLGRKISRAFCGFSGAAVSVVLMFAGMTGCQVGLGTAVDTQRPIMTITSPSETSVVNGDSVSIRGSFTDDRGVKTISASLVNLNDSSENNTVELDLEALGATVTPEGSNGSWSFTLDSTKLNDGKYSLVVTGNDGTYTSAEATRTFEIDNTAPVFLITNPTTTAVAGATSYGTSVKITGEVADDHSVSKMEVQVFRENDLEAPITFTQYNSDGSPYDTDTLVYHDIEISGGTSVTIASLNPSYANIDERNLNQVYAQMYGDTPYGSSASCFMKVTLTDSAGNTSAGSWIKSDLRSSLRTALSQSSFDIEINDIKKIINGTYSGNLDGQTQTVIKEVLGTSAVSKTEGTVSDRQYLSFSINSNIAPQYTVNGLDLGDSMIWQSVLASGTISIEVRKVLGETGVVPSTLCVYLASCDGSGNLDGNEFYPIDGKYIINASSGEKACDVSSETEQAVYTINLGTYFADAGVTPSAGKYYIVTVSGSDKDGVALSSTERYGFQVPSTGSGPSINFLGYSVGNSSASVQAAAQNATTSYTDQQTFGGSSKRYVVFEMDVTSEDGISAGSTKVTVGSKSYAMTEAVASSGKYYSAPVDLNAFATSNYTVQFEVSNASGIKSQTNRSLNIDNTGPSLRIISPAADSKTRQTSEIKLSGTANDSYSQVSSVAYCVVTNALKTSCTTDAKKIEAIHAFNGATNASSFPSWEFSFVPFTTGEISSYSSMLNASGYYVVPIWVLAEDELGNKTLEKNYTLNYDPFADRPTTEILYPVTDSTLSGAIRINGSATDNISVEQVYVQIDADGDGDFDSDDQTKLAAKGYTIKKKANINGGEGDYTVDANFWGIQASNTVSWYLTINQDGEFNSANGTDITTIRARAAAFDNNYLLGTWTDPVVININPAAPVISDTYVKQYSDAALTVETSSEAIGDGKEPALKGQWYMVATVSTKVSQGINLSKCYYKVANSKSELSTAASSPIANYVAYTDGTYKGYTIKIPLNTSSGYGNKTLRIYAVDGSGTPLDYQKDFNFSYDNTPPSQARVTINNELGGSVLTTTAGIPIANTKQKVSNNSLTFQGTVTDNGTGFDKALFYFRRVLSGTTTVELPLPKAESGSNEYSAASASKVVYTVQDAAVNLTQSGTAGSKVYLDSTTGLYGITLSEATRSNSTTFVHAKASSYKYIRAGALAYIAGGYHRISSVSGTTITFEDEIPTAYRSAFFPVAFVVDNINKESSTWMSGVNTIAYDDGDGVWEYISTQGTKSTWQASVYANELDDGPVFIDTVVVDKAGNYSAVESTKIMLANRQPRVSKVYVASDLDGNGKYSVSEMGSKDDEYGFVVSKSSNISSDFVTLGSTGVRMIDALAVGLEMVGSSTYASEGYGTGNVALKYRYKFGTSAVSASGSMGTLASGALNSFSTTKSWDTADAVSNAVNSLNKIYIPTSASGVTEDANNYLSIAVWDETAGTTAGGLGTVSVTKNGLSYYSAFGSQYAVVNIPVYVDLTDGVQPTASISNFHWEKDADGYNSVYYNGTTKMGHVELSTNSVSGVVKIEGTAHDDQRLGSLTFTVAGKTITTTYTASTATWNTLNYLTNADGNGLKYKLTTTGAFSQTSGHDVKWTLILDTASVGNGNAKTVTVKATQAKSGASQDSAVKSKSLNVVPYITSIDRGTEKGISGGTMNRSTFGNYAVAEGEKITVRGFNFGSAVSWSVKGSASGASGKTGTGASVTNSSSTAVGSFTMNVPEVSGYLTVTSGTASLNNTNNNDDYGSADTSDADEVKTNSFRATYGYNRDAEKNNTLSTDYTDDRYLSVWNLGNYFKDTDGGVELDKPVMTADASGGLHASWVSQSNSNLLYAYGINGGSNPIFRCYDQPAKYTGLGLDTKSGNATYTGTAAVTFMPEHQGLGASFAANGLSSAIGIGGAAAISVPKDSISYSATLSGTVVRVTGNPTFQLDGSNYSSYYNLANYNMNRRLGSYENPKSARYGQYMHSIWYDTVTESIKYSVTDATTSSAYDAKAGAVVGWVLVDGGFTGQDRVHEFAAYSNQADKANVLGGAARAHATVGTTTNGVYYPNVINVVNSTTCDKGATSITLNTGNSWTNNPAVGDTVALYNNTAGLYAITLKTITAVSGSKGETISWSGGVEHAVNGVAVYQGNMNVVGGSAVRNINNCAPTNQSTSAGISAGIDVTTAGYPVIAYYDAANSELRVAAANSANPNRAANWTRYLAGSGVSCSGEVSLVVDGANGVHIMFKDLNGQLCYLYSATVAGIASKTASDVEVIDTNGSLSYGNISVIQTGTSTYRPCVTYLNSANTASCIKYAQRTANAGSTGAWDYQIVPSLGVGHYAISECEISLEGRKNGWTGTASTTLVNQSLGSTETGYTTTAKPSNVDAAIAFKSKRFETAYLKKEL